MKNEKIYEAIKWAKEVFVQLDNLPSPIPDDYGRDITWSWLQDVAAGNDIPGGIFRAFKFCSSWAEKMALLTVLTTGSFEEYGNFYMPSTKDCMDNFKNVVYAYEHNRRLGIYVYGCTINNGVSHKYPDFTVDVRTGRVETLANTEYEEEL